MHCYERNNDKILAVQIEWLAIHSATPNEPKKIGPIVSTFVPSCNPPYIPVKLRQLLWRCKEYQVGLRSITTSSPLFRTVSNSFQYFFCCLYLY
jgi:hypothetical protein